MIYKLQMEAADPRVPISHEQVAERSPLVREQCSLAQRGPAGANRGTQSALTKRKRRILGFAFLMS